MLLSEKQAAEEVRKVSVDAEARNVDLVRKLEAAEGKVGQLQDSVQRCVDKILKTEMYSTDLVIDNCCRHTFGYLQLLAHICALEFLILLFKHNLDNSAMGSTG